MTVMRINEPERPGREAKFERAGEPYESQWELCGDLFAALDYRLYLTYKYHSWVGPSGELKNMLGIVVSREEFEYNLKKAAQLGISSQIDESEAGELRLYDEYIAGRVRASDCESIPLLAAADHLELDEFRVKCFFCAYISSLDPKYEKLFAYLQDDITRKYPTVSLVCRLFADSDDRLEELGTAFSYSESGAVNFAGLFMRDELLRGELRLCGDVVEYLSSGKISEKPGITLFDGLYDGGAHKEILSVQLDIAKRLDALYEDSDGGERTAVELIGDEGCGKSFQIRQLMFRKSDKCVFADAAALDYDPAKLDRAVFIAELTDSFICFEGFSKTDKTRISSDEPDIQSSDDDKKALAYIESVKLANPVFFICCEESPHSSFGGIVVEIPLPALDCDERMTLFTQYLRGIEPVDTTIEELASKFRFTAGQISRACGQVRGLLELEGKNKAPRALLHRCCYAQTVHRLDRLAVKVEAKFTWDDVVLPESQKALMREACLHIEYAHKVLGVWNFGGKISYGRGLSMLFSGAPGTGKTMCAQVIAGQLGMELYKIQLSQIISKYIGETEKNLQAVFAEAKKSGSILFFDECDSLFGKRGEVRDSNDRSANIEVAYLLQQIEDYDGVCILATNLLQNIDSAFMRRITYVIHFPFPDAAMREEIYRRTLPKEAPVSDDVDFAFLGRKINLSGGYIKNIVLNAAFIAAGEKDGKIGMRQLVRSAVNELRKNGIVVVREDFEEYADLVGE